MSFSHLYRDIRCNYAELNCAIKRISNVLNDRPVSAHRSRTFSSDVDFIMPLTLNMLLTGRSQLNLCAAISEEENPHIRKSYVDELKATWWYQYKVQCFELLLPTRKWIDVKPNLRMGNIVLIQYSSKTLPGKYRLGRILHVEVGADGLVRTCALRYHICDVATSSTRKEVRFPAQRLVLILPVRQQFSQKSFFQERIWEECDRHQTLYSCLHI